MAIILTLVQPIDPSLDPDGGSAKHGYGERLSQDFFAQLARRTRSRADAGLIQ
jgi:hypothetical protein